MILKRELLSLGKLSVDFMRAVFLIKSPLQLLNAIEAREYFGYDRENSLLVLMADRKSYIQLNNLVQVDGSWSHVFNLSELPLTIPRNQAELDVNADTTGVGIFKKDLFAILKLKSIAKNFNGIERVFIGDIGNPLMRHFFNCISGAEAVALDDGTATLNYIPIRYGVEALKKKVSAGKQIKLFFKRKFLKLNDREIDSVVFFSVYDLNVRPPDTYVQHDFSGLRRAITKLEKSNKIYFLGSPLIEAATLSEEEYFCQLERVGDCLQGERVVYVAHRREASDKLVKIGRRFGWETCLFDYPIEYQLVKVGPRPKQLVTFFSSALENCQKIFGDDMPIVSYKLNLEFFSQSVGPKGKQVDSLYEHYKSLEGESFRIVPL